mmetsp:Transcript_14332/g.22228  ORF Transcript_14332/g.22228 Transcript_14332/m.22228 type:complete len:115 (+) Transcript_14332:426-770(+)
MVSEAAEIYLLSAGNPFEPRAVTLKRVAKKTFHVACRLLFWARPALTMLRDRATFDSSATWICPNNSADSSRKFSGMCGKDCSFRSNTTSLAAGNRRRSHNDLRVQVFCACITF